MRPRGVSDCPYSTLALALPLENLQWVTMTLSTLRRFLPHPPSPPSMGRWTIIDFIYRALEGANSVTAHVKGGHMVSAEIETRHGGDVSIGTATSPLARLIRHKTSPGDGSAGQDNYPRTCELHQRAARPTPADLEPLCCGVPLAADIAAMWCEAPTADYQPRRGCSC